MVGRQLKEGMYCLMWGPKNDKDVVFLTFRKLYLCQRWGKGKACGKLITKNVTRNHSNRGCKMGRQSYLEIV